MNELLRFRHGVEPREAVELGLKQQKMVMIFLKIETAGGKWKKWKVLSLFKVIGK